MKTSFALSFFAGLLIAMAPLAAAASKAQTIIVIKDSKNVDPKDLSAITEALETNSTIQAYIDQGQWTIDIGVAAPGNVLPEVIPLLLDLTAAQPNNIELNKAAETYAFYYARTFQGGKPAGETRNLIRQTVANLVGISPALLQRWPDFEQFLVANGIERQLKDLGDQIKVGRYGIPTLNVNGKPYSWTIVKQRLPIDEKTGKLTGFTYTKKGIQPNRELEAEFEALVNAARTEAEKSAGDQSQRIAKLQTWINTIQKQLRTEGGLPTRYVSALEMELNGSQPNGVQVELQEIEKNQKSYPQLQPQLDKVYEALENAKAALQHAKYLLLMNELKTTAEKKQAFVDLVQQLEQWQASLQQPITAERVNDIRNDLANLSNEFERAEKEPFDFEGKDSLINHIKNSINDLAVTIEQVLKQQQRGLLATPSDAQKAELRSQIDKLLQKLDDSSILINDYQKQTYKNELNSIKQQLNTSNIDISKLQGYFKDLEQAILTPARPPGLVLAQLRNQIIQIRADLNKPGVTSYIVGRINQLQKDLTTLETNPNLSDIERSDIQQLRNELNTLNPNQQQQQPPQNQ